MSEEEEYEIMPHKTIERIKREINDLKMKAVSDEKISNESLKKSLDNLTVSINSLMSLFKEASEEMKIEEESKEEIKEKIDPLLNRIDTIESENRKIARGILAIADMIKQQERPPAPRPKKTKPKQRETIKRTYSEQYVPRPKIVQSNNTMHWPGQPQPLKSQTEVQSFTKGPKQSRPQQNFTNPKHSFDLGSQQSKDMLKDSKADDNKPSTMSPGQVQPGPMPPKMPSDLNMPPKGSSGFNDDLKGSFGNNNYNKEHQQGQFNHASMPPFPNKMPPPPPSMHMNMDKKKDQAFNKSSTGFDMPSPGPNMPPPHTPGTIGNMHSPSMTPPPQNNFSSMPPPPEMPHAGEHKKEGLMNKLTGMFKKK